MFFLQDPKGDVRLQPPVMETDSGVDGGNYCMVYTVLPNLHLVLISKLLSSSSITYILLPDKLSCILYETAGSPKKISYCSFIITEAAQPNTVSQHQSMS